MFRYKVKVLSPERVPLGETLEPLSIELVVSVNSPGYHVITLSPDDPMVNLITDRSIIEVHTKLQPGAPWYREYRGFHRDLRLTSGRNKVFQTGGPGILSLLSRPIIAWKSGIADRSTFVDTPAETIAKTLVKYNGGPYSLISEGRLGDFVLPELSIEADLGRGAVLSHFSCSYDPLLLSLQRLSAVGQGDFSLVSLPDNSWEFVWFPNQLGTDRSSTVIFSPSFDNMENPAYTEVRSEERNVGYVAGQGEGVLREVEVVEGPDYTSETRQEIFINATDIELGNLSGLQARGQVSLSNTRLKRNFTFTPLDVLGTRYSQDYFLGDIVTAISPFTGESFVRKVVSVKHLVSRSSPVQTTTINLGNI